MSKSVRLSDELVAIAREKAALFHRSPPQQIEHWAQIGRVMESALSYGTQERVKQTATRESLEDAYAMPGTPEGKRRAQEVIQRTSTPITSSKR